MSFNVYCEEHQVNHTLTDGQAERVIYMQAALLQEQSTSPLKPQEVTICVAEILWNTTDASYQPQIDATVAQRIATNKVA